MTLKRDVGDLLASLPPEEKAELLATLLMEMEWPIPDVVFQALMQRTVSVPIELAVVNEEGQVLMTPRKDAFFEGLHIPGTVLRDNETVQQAMERLLAKEVPGTVKGMQSLGWVELTRGPLPNQNPFRHEISLLHACYVDGKRVSGEFFSPGELPDNTLPHHKMLIPLIGKRMWQRRRGIHW